MKQHSIHAIVAELQILQGAQIQKITQPLQHELLLRLRKPGENVFLFFSNELRQERFHLLQEKLPSLPTPPAFCMLLRKHLEGSVLQEIQDHFTDKLVCFVFGRGASLYQLYVELVPQHANWVLCENELFLGSWRAVFPLRPMKKGSAYLPPSLPENFAQKERIEENRPEIRWQENLGIWEQCKENQKVASQTNRESGEKRFEKIKQLVLQTLQKRKKKCEKLLQNIRKDLLRCEKNLLHENFAELLKGQLHLIQKGQTEIEVIDYFSPEMEKTKIPLVASKTPQENLQHLFNQVKRAKRGQENILPRLEQAEEQFLELEIGIEEVQVSTDMEFLLQWLPEETEKKVQTASKKQENVPYRLFVSKSGCPIWVGKNSRANDDLTFRYAKGNDLWLHAKGVPGSHVIVPIPKGKSIDSDTLVDAVTLAVFYSKSKEDTFVDVSYTPVRFVKKKKGDAPGLVHLLKSDSFPYRRDPERLERLFSVLSSKENS